MNEPATLTVAELQARLQTALVAAVPGPVWVRGEVSGFRRTSRGAVFFRLADTEADGHAIDVMARARVMMEVERALDAEGIGRLRDGVEVRVRATVGVDTARSLIRLSLLEVDPSFVAGRLALDRQEVLRRMAADGSLVANRRLRVPLVPLRVGLVTSRGSAAHADFLHQLGASGFRFAVRTAHAPMQGRESVGALVRALERLGGEPVDVIALVRGGGARLDLAAFDQEAVGRAVAAAPVPIISGIGHEIDRSVVDEAAAVSVKTPTAAAEWLVGRVAEFAGRVDLARRMIGDEARSACARAEVRLEHVGAVLGGVRDRIARQGDGLGSLGSGIADGARRALSLHRRVLGSIEEVVGAMGVDSTLRRGFALLRNADGEVVRSSAAVHEGELLDVRLADGSLVVRAETVP